MGNEQAVTDLINLMDGAIEEVTFLERQLDEMDSTLLIVRDSVELIEEKDSLGQVERQNNEKLRKELEEFLYHLDTISDNHIRVLRNAHLSDPTSINQCCLAARAMNQFLNKKSELCSMAAFQSRVDELNVLRDEFVDKFFSHIAALFERMGTMVEGQGWDSMILQIQTQRYRCLLPFCELISWLKSSRSNAYQETLRRYIKEAEALFRKEFDRFFGAINQRAKALSGRRDSSVGSISKTDQDYVSLLETIMGETRNAVEAEQKFCIRFFHISGDLLNTIDTKSSESGDSSGAFGGGKTIERQFNDQVKNIVQPIFSSFLPNLSQFIEICGSQNNLCLVLLYVNLSKKMQTHQDTTSFFTGLYGSSMILFKQRVDQLIQSYAYSFESYRPPKKIRVGILPIISQYENLAKHAEMLFENSERRTDLEKWHEKLIDALFKGINNVAESPNSKSPPAVVRLENFHQLYLSLSALKIECLDGRRKEARKIYQSSIDNYVKEYMGRPLEKIHVFFEQIEKALENGIRPEEIGYQQQFSRLELKKVVQGYPGKEVKKGLENLYRKVEKHLIDGSSLIEVVWRQMQDDFLKQLKHYQQLIGKCYPNSRADLEVSIQDVLQYFSEIAQQH
uniref:Exocyst complex component Sec3 C-terminal domain-containing protein n=1 Tax=Panagrolaimus superbus TaxID=310955 RepID=A0A914Y6L1_9BILA